MRAFFLTILLATSLIGCGGETNDTDPVSETEADGSSLMEDTLEETEDIVPMEDMVSDIQNSDVSEAEDTNQADMAGAPDVSRTDITTPSDDIVQPAPEWGPALCPAAPEGVNTGTAIGDQLPSMGFQSCDGESFDLNELCGADATWIFFAHSWCGDCQATAAFAETVHGYFQDANVAVVQIVVHSFDKNLPTAADCDNWKELYQLTNVVTLFDPIFLMVQLAETGQTGQSVFLDKNRVIQKKLHVFTEAEVIGEIQTILNEQENP